MLAWLDELIAQTCASPPVLVGHLLGGAIAARFAVRRGERLDRLVLVDTCGLRWYRPTAGFALAMVLARITVPTTLIWGRHDLQTPVRTAEAAASRHRWPLHVVDDAADDPAHEQPDAFLEAFRAALDDTPRPVDRSAS